MNFTFRVRAFLYLLGLLALFLASQAVIYIYVEWLACRTNPGESMWVGLQETAHALGLSLLMIPGLAWFAWRISLRLVTPLREMADTADRVRAGNRSDRIETGMMPDDETKRLAQAMNAAFDGYAAVLKRLERFSGDAAHQLRTPIAAIRNLGEVALARPRSEEEYRRTVGTMLSELDRMTRLVEQLLQLSQFEAGVLRHCFAPVSLHQVVDLVLRAYGPLAAALHLRIQTGLPDTDPPVSGMEDLLVELLGNLLDNAFRHSPDGGLVRIAVTEDSGGEVCISVRDEGPGIPREYAQAVFERFIQIPGLKAGTMGLGLSLAAEIARLHGGRLELANPGQAGACFECRLPSRPAGAATPPGNTR